MSKFSTFATIWGVFLAVAAIGILGANAPNVAKSDPAKPAPGQEVSYQYANYVLTKRSGRWNCKKAIENAAKYDLRWTTWGDAFDRFTKYARQDEYIRFVGDKAEAQNGFGNWVRVNYRCLFDPDTGIVKDVSIDGGKLPSD